MAVLNFVFFLRYNHIKSFGDLRKQFPGATPASAPAAADDDDVDLFASDEEEDAEAAKIKEQRVSSNASTHLHLVIKCNSCGKLV